MLICVINYMQTNSEAQGEGREGVQGKFLSVDKLGRRKR